MFGRFGGDARNAAALERIERWVRARYGLPDAALVLVTEGGARAPGFPPRETVIRFWDAAGDRFRICLFKPAREVAEAELPPAWLKSALADDGEPDCC